MLIGMVLDSEKEIIVPFTEGKFVRVYNEKTHNFHDAINPALKLDKGKRGAIINWFNNNGVELICSPPGTLCELSYKSAQEKQMKFYRLQPNTSFFDFKIGLKKDEFPLKKFLKENEILPSN